MESERKEPGSASDAVLQADAQRLLQFLVDVEAEAGRCMLSNGELSNHLGVPKYRVSRALSRLHLDDRISIRYPDMPRYGARTRLIRPSAPRSGL